MAEIEEDKLHDAELERKRIEHERTEKAYLRYKHAMEKESLKEVGALTYFNLMKYTAKGINASNMLVKLKQSRYSHITRK